MSKLCSAARGSDFSRSCVTGMCIVLLAGLLIAGSAKAADVYARSVRSEDTLAGYWRLEGDLSDETGQAPAEAGDGELQYVDGPQGKAASLESSRFIKMGECPHLDLPQTSVELLFKPTAEPAQNYNPCLIAKRSGHRETRFSVHLMRDLSRLALWNGNRVVTYQVPLRPIEPGTWYHLAVSWKPNQLNMYLNGVKCEGGNGNFSADRAGLPLQVGSSTPEGTELFHGAVDEVAVYGSALTAEQVAKHVEALGWKERMESIKAEQRRRRQERLEERMAAIEKRMNDPELLKPYEGRAHAYTGEHLGAVQLPVGGIGSGVLHVNGEAELNQWQIFNNHRPIDLPHTFFGVRAKTEGGEAVLRTLQTTPVGPFHAFPELEFRGEYPFGWYDFKADDLPIDVRMEAFNPLIPLNAKDSAIPCAVFNLTARNTGDSPVELSFLASQQNAVGLVNDAKVSGRQSERYGGNVTEFHRAGDASLLHMTSNKNEDDPGYGDMVLMTMNPDATGNPAWSDLQSLHGDLADDGRLSGPESAGPSPDGRSVDGALAVPFTLEPGQQRNVTFVLTWHFPHTQHGSRGWGGRGNRYAHWWEDATDVAKYVREHMERLTEDTRLYHDTFYASNLPRWLLDRISSQVAVLNSKTCFWTEDGYFGGWEGCNPSTGCCFGNCTHVWHYAQAHARLFPEIGKRMREEALAAQKPDGAIPYRQRQNIGPATDGQCGEILGCYREYCMSPDGEWLDERWPRIKKAMDYVIQRWDPDEDGVLTGPQHNTLDGELSGNSSWLGSLYVAALNASEQMALVQDEEKVAQRYRRILESGRKKQNAALWNGEYYEQNPGEKLLQDYVDGCHIDQVLGQWWAHQMDLDRIYPQDRVRQALRSLLKYNFRPDFHGIPQAPRKFVADDDAGTKMITWPHGPRPPHHMRYADECMTGFEYAAAATMVQEGLLRRGFAMTRAVWERYDGRLREGLTGAAWGYSGNPFGDDECGKFYARAMSVWSMLLACQGFIYEGPAGRLGFEPVWQPADHRSFFTAAEGWGVFTQKRSDEAQIERIEVAHGKVRVKELIFQLPEGARPADITVKQDDRELDVESSLDDRRLTLRLSEPVEIEERSGLYVRIKTR